MSRIKRPSYTARVFFRATSNQDQLIKAAAAQDGRTVSSWVRLHAVRAAEQQLEARQQISSSESH